MAASSCEDCHTTKKCVTIRQSDLLLCNNCEKVRKDAETAKNTASGQWKVTPMRTKQPSIAPISRKSSGHKTPQVDKPRTDKPTTPKVIKSRSDKQIIAPANNKTSIQLTEHDTPVCSNQICSIKPDDVTCNCFICNKDFHLTCVKLTRRPPKTSNWCCPTCRDVPSLVRELTNTVNVLSAWQRSMYEHQQELKAENRALKEQLSEVMSIMQKERQSTDDSRVQDQAHPPGNVSESDISSTEYEPEEETTPWVTVQRRNSRTAAPRRPDGRKRETKFIDVKRTMRYDLRKSRGREIPVQRYQRETQRTHPKQPIQNNDFSRPRKSRFQERVDHVDRRVYHHDNNVRGSSRVPCYNCGLNNHLTKDCHVSISNNL